MEQSQTSAARQPDLTLDRPRPSRPARLASVVVEEIADRIVSGALAAGSVLPTEAALGEQFGFSRTVMREGLKLLEERGLVRVEQGRGTTVQPRESWNLLDPAVLRIALEYDHDMALLDQLITVRRVLEADMTRVAASRLTDGELAELAGNIERMASSTADYERFQALDLAFHAIVMNASGNEVGRAIVGTIHRHGGRTRRLSSPGGRASLMRTVAEHRAIAEALARRDGELAASRIEAHIDSAWAERRRRRNGRRGN